jgi:glycosyltransferase involved in cell wall biosynthesis
MKILLVMDPGILVPPKGYGGHERLVYMFAQEYLKMGHEVHLLVTTGSKVPGCTVHDFGKEGFPPKKKDALLAIPTAWKFLWKHRNDFDLVHNFGRLLYLLPILNHRIKKIMSYGREIDAKNIAMINKLPNKNLQFTAPSDDCVSTGNVAGKWTTVYNAINTAHYDGQPSVEPGSPLIFLSRIEKVKGCHVAIDVAKATGEKLIIAGNISPLPEEKEYFEKEIKPHIDGEQIKYVGVVNDEQKNYYLGRAKAMLFPINIREAFGMVMAEAMACGTPVIGFPHGAVPEVIVNNENGFVVNNKEEMIEAVKKIPSINRNVCRNHAVTRFDVSVLARQYLGLFN